MLTLSDTLWCRSEVMGSLGGNTQQQSDLTVQEFNASRPKREFSRRSIG